MEAGTVNKHDWSDTALQTWNKWPLMHTKHNTTSVDPAVHPVCVFEVDKQSSWQWCKADRGDVKWWGFCWQPALLEQVNQVQQTHTAGSTELQSRKRHTHKQKARKERGMSRDKLTHGDMHTRKIRAKATIRKMDSSTVLPTWKRRTGFILVLFMGEIEDITVYYAWKHKTPAIFTPRHQSRQTSEQTGGCGKKPHHQSDTFGSDGWGIRHMTTNPRVGTVHIANFTQRQTISSWSWPSLPDVIAAGRRLRLRHTSHGPLVPSHPPSLTNSVSQTHAKQAAVSTASRIQLQMSPLWVPALFDVMNNEGAFSFTQLAANCNAWLFCSHTSHSNQVCKQVKLHAHLHISVSSLFMSLQNCIKLYKKRAQRAFWRQRWDVWCSNKSKSGRLGFHRLTGRLKVGFNWSPQASTSYYRQAAHISSCGTTANWSNYQCCVGFGIVTKVYYSVSLERSVLKVMGMTKPSARKV